jgi:hypothetical protein
MYLISPTLIGYTGADYANNTDARKSVGGHVFLLCGRGHHLEKSETTLNCESEYMAIWEESREAVCLQKIVRGTKLKVEPIPLRVDNSALALIRIPEAHAPTKRIDKSKKSKVDSLDEACSKITLKHSLCYQNLPNRAVLSILQKKITISRQVYSKDGEYGLHL